MKLKKIIILNLLIVAFALFLFLGVKVWADAPIYEISNFEELVEAARISRESGNQNYTFLLTNDIEITEENQNALENSDFKYISFGSSDYPFAGIFDGQGHSISNLKYKSTLAAISDTGLFSNTTTGAVIKNLKIINADIQADYRGGIVAGYSEGTTFENIIVKDSHIFVSAVNNVITLITDGGIRGGAIVGEAENCVLYNCESEGTRVNTNSTSGVAALAGKGLYLGGLVGTAISTDVEYSRVIGGLVKNYYDVVVGAVGGNTLYVGGIIGQMKNGSKAIDCFSTAELNYYCATYVSVGAGNSGHIGGIAAAMYGSSNEIIRCHYAGKATSRQYNAVLVIPIIQDNLNISGIADVYEGGSVVNTYFKPSINDGVNMNVLGDSNQTSSYGPLSDDRYEDKDYWQTQNYDFYGNIKRQTDYNSNHTNKWVMDNNTKMPIHGMSISAAIDFTNAGKVTIGQTELVRREVYTENASIFAVQGLKIHEKTVSISAEENNGYRFVKWYKVPNVTVWQVDEQHNYYDEIFSRYEEYSTDKDLNNIEFNDNDLFVGYYQAQVVFHDINGSYVDKNTGNSVNSSGENDWYDYLDKIPYVEPNTKPVSETATLIGWTTTRSSEAGGGYSSITVPELTALKNNNTFYEGGEDIIETLELYPVYMDLISNINTVFEGNEQDSVDDVSLRDGVGQTSVRMNENGEIVINVIGSNPDESFPDGYRFLGWYDEEGMRVSKEREYTLRNVDLSAEHTYTAKLEYRIEYYVRAYAQDNGDAFNTSELFATRWQGYNTAFENITAPGYLRESITHWGTQHVNHGSTDNPGDAYNSNIVGPLKVYSHNNLITTGSGTAYQVFITTDFPGSGHIIDEKATAGAKFRFTPISNRYHLLFWTFERSDRNGWSYINNPMQTAPLSTLATYKGMAMVTTDINFYNKNNEITTVTRKYEDNLFMSQDTTYTYKFPFFHTDTNVNTNPEDGNSLNNTITLGASPSENDMTISGYVFLGWISSLEVSKNSTTWNNIYDVADDLYCTSDIYKAKPYLLDQNQLVYETQDVYPVYAKWNITTTTNVKSYGGLYNTPPNPSYTIVESTTEKGEGVVTIVPDETTFIYGNEGAIYDLLELVRVYEDGTEEVININNENTYKYNVEAGQNYVFMAKYRPYTVVYHINMGETRIIIKNYLDLLEDMPSPTYSMGNTAIFVGWTDKTPENSKYHYFQTYEEYENEDLTIYTKNTIVYNSLELWPVYVELQITVNSNIDTILTQNSINLESVRFITRPSIKQVQLNAQESVLDNYIFEGWYKNYQSSANKGELLSQHETVVLENNESIVEDIYTAVYTKTLSINYYNTSGEIIYTANIDEGEERSFVTQILDNEENIIEVPIDSQTYEEISNSLEQNEMFINWQWQKPNGTMAKWEDFYNITVTDSMDLYPIIKKIEATDPDNQNVDMVIEKENEGMHIFFSLEYQKPYVLLHLTEIAYDSNGINNTKDINNMNIYLTKGVNSNDEPIATGVTDQGGICRLNLFGDIIITQNSNEDQNDVFIYEVLDENNNLIIEFSVPVGETKTITLPYGRYTINRKDNWAWRYSQNLRENFVISNQRSEEELTLEGNKLTNKWFDGASYIDNKYE